MDDRNAESIRVPFLSFGYGTLKMKHFSFTRNAFEKCQHVSVLHQSDGERRVVAHSPPHLVNLVPDTCRRDGAASVPGHVGCEFYAPELSEEPHHNIK